MQVINPALNSVPYANILIANLNALQKGGKGIKFESLLEKMAIFLGSFDPRQMRYLGSELVKIIESLAFHAQRTGQVCLITI